MPIYEYQCPTCGGEQEHIMSFKQMETESITCIKCSVKMDKILSVPGAPKFKGSGFYATDYKDK